MITTSILTFSVFILLAIRCVGQHINISKIDSFLNALDKHHLAMGSVTISVDRQIKYQRSIGARYVDSTRFLRPDSLTKYRIGSITKMFTAVMIFQLVEEGKLNLDDRLSTFFTDLPNAGTISIRQMLYHRSGLPEYTEPFSEFEQWMNSSRTRQQLLDLIAEKKPAFEPDQKAGYTNSNYLVLGYIIEKKDGVSYRQALKKRIADRVGLVNTSYAVPFDILRNEALSYVYLNGQWMVQKQTDTSVHQGAGMITSTPNDLAVFIEALNNGRLLNRSSLGKMTTWLDSYGMGVFPLSVDTVRGMGHDGRIEGFSSSLQYYPERKLAIAYCTNGEVYSKNDIMQVLARICLDKPQVVPLFENVELPDSVLNAYTGRYVNSELGIAVLITKNDTSLAANVKGNTFSIEAIGKDEFIFRPMGLLFRFDSDKNELLIRETYKTYNLRKGS